MHTYLLQIKVRNYLNFSCISSFACYFFHHIAILSEDAVCFATDVKITTSIKLTLPFFALC